MTAWMIACVFAAALLACAAALVVWLARMLDELSTALSERGPRGPYPRRKGDG